MTGQIVIPEISDMVLDVLAARIKVVGRFSVNAQNCLYSDAKGELYFITSSSPKRDHDIYYAIGVNKPASGIEEIAKIATFHLTTGKFCPTFAGVVAQIPAEYLEKVIAFEIPHFEPPQVVSEGDKIYDRATTLLYGNKPDSAPELAQAMYAGFKLLENYSSAVGTRDWATLLDNVYNMLQAHSETNVPGPSARKSLIGIMDDNFAVLRQLCATVFQTTVQTLEKYRSSAPEAGKLADQLYAAIPALRPAEHK